AGGGWGARLLFRKAPPGINPLSPENPLIFAGNPFSGTGVTTSGKYAIACKSPLTGFVGDSISSGSLADELKKMPFDALVITGRAEAPTYLLIIDQEVRFCSADHLMRSPASEAERRIKAELRDPMIRVAAIGPAGEVGVGYACVTNEGRQAGRTGAGAVMGSKNLKAIAFRGVTPCPVAHPKELEAVAARLRELSEGPATAKYRGPGTIANLSKLNKLAALPSFNFRRSSFDGAGRINAEQFQKRLVDNDSRVDASRDWEHVFDTGENKGSRVKGRVEYESLFALGPLCGIDDPDLIIRASALCDELGIDTISTGGTIAWAMESFEKGLINSSDTDGLGLRFGDGRALLSTIEKIGRREGIGDLLAQGSKRASAAVGGGSEAWAMHVKGLEMPGYDPRALKTLALGLAVNARGACHNRSSVYDFDLDGYGEPTDTEPDRGVLTASGEDSAAVMDSLILSKFLRRCFDDFYPEAARIYELITGWEMSGAELQQVGARINTLRKAFNLREGWTRADDTLPSRVLGEEATEEGSMQGGLSRAELEAMIDDYYRARGWTTEGSIPGSKLEELGLHDLVSNSSATSSHVE
ncbi:MAG: aldehyde ferredoxin oxidoreductase family protein, partial [Dehalococcoidia bacterium]